MFRPILPVIICLAGPLSAQSAAHCGPHQCDHVLVCIGMDGLRYDGVAIGNGPVNTIRGQLNTGVTCTATRMHYNKPFAGEITLACNDGTSAVIEYDAAYFGASYSYGQSATGNGLHVRMWVAHDMMGALSDQSARSPANASCAIKAD